MKARPIILSCVCLLLILAAWFFWPRTERSPATPAKINSAAPSVSATAPAATKNSASAIAENSGKPSAASTNRLAFRLANTSQPIGQLMLRQHAILLENALLDTDVKVNLSIPKNLRATGEPGAYIVQARGRIDDAFRAQLANAGAEIISYIPNNAYLVQLSGAGAGLLASSADVQTVLPYEPYYKVQSSLLGLAVNEKPLPPGTYLTLGIYDRGAEATLAQVQKLGGQILSQDRSPFGQRVRVRPPTDWISLANLPGVQLVEPAHLRVAANDLSRVTTGVSLTSTTNINYLNLSGLNVTVEVNDTGIDANHPDLQGRVEFNIPTGGVDVAGHGTFVGGQIAGSGLESTTVTNASGSILPASAGQFRGKAPLANLFSVGFLGPNDVDPGDSFLQEAPALTNALISNNSWVNGGDFDYDLSAASYDAAVRDALPGVTGPQPVLFVFAAGNDGAGADDGTSGDADSIQSPATAKDVITVGALEQQRNITNVVMTVIRGRTNTSTAWEDMSDSGYEVAGYSARGNVGVQTEGTYGRFKPDVVAPGSFVVSTRSTTWDTNAYYNPTNYATGTYTFQTVSEDQLNDYTLFIPRNAVGLTIRVVRNSQVASPFSADVPLYVSLSGDAATNHYDIVKTNGEVSIPPDSGGAITSIQSLQGTQISVGVGNTNAATFNYNLQVTIATTNNVGNYYQQLQQLNDHLGTMPEYYRYESGTSMAAAEVSGILALMQDFFTNTLHLTPSPALFKAMLINGARPNYFYNLKVQNAINFEGWGVINLPNSIPATLTNGAAANQSLFFLDQSPTNALATGDRQTYLVTLAPGAQSLPLRITLAWTDPPGNPAAAIKLVNNLDLVVSNADMFAAPLYYGNDIGNDVYNTPESTNAFARPDDINNIENVFIAPNSGTNFYITIAGTAVNVNAVTTQTNNIVQDFALVVASGNGSDTNGFTLSLVSSVSNPTSAQRITYVTSTNSALVNQMVGASSPLLGTNQLSLPAGSVYGNNALLTIGQTNQWHFYVVTNNALDSAGSSSDVTNAAFVTFLPPTLSIPREGVYADPTANPTRPEADLDLFVTTDSNLLTLSPVTISNCINGTQVGASMGSIFRGASLGRGGSEFVVDTNSTPGQVYYVGVQSEDQMASEYGFLPEFSSIPFSPQDTNGNVAVQFFPLDIPDGDAVHPGFTNSIGLAIYPIDTRRLVVTNILTQQDPGDLVISLSHDNATDILVNHDSPNVPGTFVTIYDDSGQGDIAGSQPSDGPGSLQNFIGKSGEGVWILHASDGAPGFVGSLQGFLQLQPHQALTGGLVTFHVPPKSWIYDYIDVPVGYTNLQVFAIDETPPSPNHVTLAVKLGSEPTLTNADEQVLLDMTSVAPPGLSNSISIGPPLTPGRYFVGLYNPDNTSHTVELGATPAFDARAIATVDYDSPGPVPLLDDAVTTNSIFVTSTNLIQGINIGLRVDHPRISDLAFTLISPDGTRYLLMENRGGTTTNGAGITLLSTNSIPPHQAAGGAFGDTNLINFGATRGTLSISYDFYTIPDEMTVYYGTDLVTNNLLYDSRLISGSNTVTVSFPPASPTDISSNLTIVMNQFGNPATNADSGDQWTYTAGGTQTNYVYLTFTEDTNLTTTPIKFATPPFTSAGGVASYTVSDFEAAAAGNYAAPASVDGWQVVSNQVSVVNDPSTAQQGSNFLALADGTISNSLPTIPGVTYSLTFSYRGPGIVSLWRGENNGADSIAGNSLNGPGVAYSPGKVGQAFVFNGTSTYEEASANPSLDVGLGNGFTLDAWINPTDVDNFHPIFEWSTGVSSGGPDAPVGVQFHLTPYNGSGTLFANLEDTSDGFHVVESSGGVISANSFQHVALTYSKSTGMGILYWNGMVVATNYLGVFTPKTSPNLYLGYRPVGTIAPLYYEGLLDELSVYNRSLSASEIKAIYQLGSAGKFDTNSTASLPQSLAEATIEIPGISSNSIFGNNANWQIKTVTFTATQSNTPVVISGLEPGVLLDSFAVSGSGSNLYYLPEQSLSPLLGTDPHGLWQLEILDNRAGATNNAVLDSWQLEFTFANTNYTPLGSLTFPILTNGVPSTNSTGIPPNGVVFYQVNVPLNADAATNFLLFADYPLNVWWSTNYPPTVTNANDFLLISGTNGMATLTTNSTPPLIPGTTYYLGVQNTNSVITVTNYAVEVDFHFTSSGAPYAFTQPATLVTGTQAQLNGMATPNGFTATAWFQYGLTTNYGSVTPPVNVGNGTNVVYVPGQISALTTNKVYHFRLVVSNAVGVVHGFDQVLDEANVVAWGANYLHQITVPSGLTNFNATAIAGAYDHSLAIKNDETVVAWGDNTSGQTVVPAGLTNVAAVAGGEYYSMALKKNGTVTAWGSDIFGTPTNVPAGLTNVVTIAGGTYSSLALKSDGTITAWGINFFGLTNVPAGLSNVVAVAGGAYHNLAIRNNGTVAAWGDDSAGQTNVPANLTNVVAIAAGTVHSLALKGDGTVVAWGDNGAGQTNVPAGLSNVVAIAAGGFDSLALKANGNVVSWGDNSAGQGSTPAELTNGIIAIASGYLHTLALTPLSHFNTNIIIFDLLDRMPLTNSISGGDTIYYRVNVPTNADFATNSLLFALNGPLNVWFSTNSPPTIGGTNDVFLFSSTNDFSIFSTNSVPRLIPGIYYLGVNNTNNFTVNYGIEVDFHLTSSSTNSPSPTNSVPIGGIIYTNINGKPGFLLTWFAPSNDLFQVQYKDDLTATNWNTFTNIISYNTNFLASATNAQFNFFDDGSQTPPGLPPMRFYRLILYGTATNAETLTLPAQNNQTIYYPGTLTVTNTAVDSDTNATLSYLLTNAPAGATISTNGVITWTPGTGDVGTTNTFTTIVTNTAGLMASNSFVVYVLAAPTFSFSSVTLTNGEIFLTWSAPTNDSFYVESTTNLSPPVMWITNSPVITSTNGIFSFLDTNLPVLMEFYRLELLP